MKTNNENSTKKELPFDKRILKAGLAPNIISAALIFTFQALFMSMTIKQLPWALLIISIIVGLAEFVLAPITNVISTAKITKDIIKWNEEGLDDTQDRTTLFELIMEFPLKKSFETFLYFFACSALFCIAYHIVPVMNINIRTSVFTFIACVYGSYFAALLAYGYSERLCKPLAQKLVEEGIDNDYVHKRTKFGMGMTLRAVLYIIIPSIYLSVLYVVVIVEGYQPLNGKVPTPYEQFIRIGLVCIVGITLNIFLTLQYYLTAKTTSEKLSDTLTKALTTNSKDIYTQTSIGDQMQYSIWILNNILTRFNNLIIKSTQIGEKVLHSTNNLSVAASQLSSTSLEQNAAVKEILATMEDSSALSQNIASTIVAVSKDSEKTFQDVSSGFEILQEIMKQNEEINTANALIIDGIKELETQIENIGNVISIINDIADQTRIIAFNAELESVSAGEEGHNFHIVSTEIRRLANNTLNSISETQKYIENIQMSAQNLIASSNTGTNLIQEEMELTQELENRYTEIKTKADLSASKSAEISEIINQQTTSFGQIVITLRQISASIDSFTNMTKTLNDTAIQMQQVASKLSTIQTN